MRNERADERELLFTINVSFNETALVFIANTIIIVCLQFEMGCSQLIWHSLAWQRWLAANR